MVEPDRSLPLLKERPPLGWSLLSRVAARLACRFAETQLRQWVQDRRARNEALLGKLLPRVMSCVDRTELKSIVGKPRYAMEGRHFATIMNGERRSPDRVEHYTCQACWVDLWFVGDRLDSASGAVALNPWEHSLHLLEERRERKKWHD
jgi:hypothetical protein